MTLEVFLLGCLFGYGIKCGAVARKKVRDELAEIKALVTPE